MINDNALMGGPLSEAEDAAARIRAYLDACSGANSFGREIRWELRDAEGHPYNLPRADLVAVIDALGVLEGQLATAQAELDEQHWYGEQLQSSIDTCSGNHLPTEPYEG